ncbi:MAG: hypothetical protein QM496_07090 [Verrucomicrobiota bacterium]
MIQRFVEVHYLNRKESEPSFTDIEFWLREMRTVGLIVEVAQRFKSEAQVQVSNRVLLRAAIEGDQAAVREKLVVEIEAEREVDRLF